MRGLRVHLAGSAAEDCDQDLLLAAHGLISSMTHQIVASGGGLVLGAGAEPRGSAGEPCIFDWTALASIVATPDPGPDWPPLRPERFVAVSTQSGLSRIPEDRRDIWDQFRCRSDVDVLIAPPGWRMAGIIREQQVERGDILVVVGGGAGVEHLAQSYVADGKPVVPIAADLGGYSRDGSGGSPFLHARAVSEPDSFFHLLAGKGSASGRLLSLKLAPNSDAAALAKEITDLLGDLRRPTAFYVRLLETSHPDFRYVETFFRSVVDRVVDDKGFMPDEMGGRTPTVAFMNLDIFRSIHFAGLVIVDLTGVRPNCTMELGYAMARKRRVILTAMDGTSLPFDPDKLPTHFWKPGIGLDAQIAEFDEWFDRYFELPRLFD